MALLRLLVGFFVHAAAAVVFESIRTPSGWSVAGDPSLDQAVHLKIALKQQSVAAFEQKLLSISDPSHADYGKHMKSQDVKDLLSPTGATIQTVTRWLQEDGVAFTVNNDWIDLTTNVQEANDLLNTTFQWWKDERTDTVSLRTLSYSVPADVANEIDLIQPTTRFGGPQAMRSTIHSFKRLKPGKKGVQGPVNATCNSTITPSCLLGLYNVHYKADPNSGSRLGYVSFLEQYTRYSDLALFQSQVAPYTYKSNFSFVSLHGGLNNQTDRIHDSMEGNLDGQYAIAVAYPLPVTEFSVAGRGPLVPDLDQPNQASNNNEPYLEYLTALLKLPQHQIPQVLVHSYGEPEQSVPKSYNKRVCRLFAELGARGISVIFASGDFGVGDECVSNDGKNTTEYQPIFPAACPWVTAVGGTYKVPERAAAFSSGGFSRVHPRPDYQDEAVSRYLDILGDRFKGYYNRKGRAFPDVSAQAVDFTIFDGGFRTWASGTSASAPTFAGIVALLNAARLSSGKAPLGFLNPWLYKIGCEAFNDITVGQSIGCSGASIGGVSNGGPRIPGAGFNATQGWDPVTGLGTPDFGKLLRLSTPSVRNKGGPVP